MKIKNFNNWVEISESAYKHNLAFFKKILNANCELAVVVKANAYGHGMIEIARLAAKNGIHYFCVHSLEEALYLRANGIQGEILIMGPVLLNQLTEVIKNKFCLVLYNKEHLAELIKKTKKLKKSVKVHLKLETGTYRQGIAEEELQGFLQDIKEYSLIKIEAVYSHFANIEDTTIHDYALNQLKKFIGMKNYILNHGFPGVKVHLACSAAALLFPETHFNLVRVGISQYGLWPSRETFVSYKTIHPQNSKDILKPVLNWKTRVAQIKTVPINQYIGYGCTFKTSRETKVAILPVGYADGYDRGLSNQSYVLINGKRAPLRGRICMNLIIVDITDIPDVKLEDEVIMIGKQGQEMITVDYLAGLIGTINYEFITRINWNIPRIVVN